MKINKGFISQKIGDEIAIFDGEKSIFYTLNSTAGIIFNKLKKGESIQEITLKISKEYEVDEKIVLKDISNLIRKLKKLKIISDV